MSPDEVVNRLAELGAKITCRTLYNYAEWGLIVAPTRGASRGTGKWANYPDGTVKSAFNAYTLMELFHSVKLVKHYLKQPSDIQQIILKFVIGATKA